MERLDKAAEDATEIIDRVELLAATEMREAKTAGRASSKIASGVLLLVIVGSVLLRFLFDVVIK